jgi:hypothetical protein
MTTIINAATSGGLIQTADTSGVLQLQTASTAAVTIDASQNVGIGTASPSVKLDIVGELKASNGTYGTYLTYSVGNQTGIVGTYGNHGLEFRTNNTERMRITSAGLVQVLASSSNSTFTGGGEFAIKNSASNPYMSFHSNTGTRYVYMQASVNGYEINSESGYLVLSSSGTERMRLDTSGYALFATTSQSQSSGNGVKIKPAGAVYAVNAGEDGFSYYNSTAGAYRFYVQSTGTISATNTTISAISDQRLKENIRDLDDGLDVVMALKPRKFDWKAGKGADIKNARGFIAQEFEIVFPDLIDEWKDPAPEGEEPYKSVRQDLIPTLVKAIQEQQALITDLTTRLAALEGAK